MKNINLSLSAFCVVIFITILIYWPGLNGGYQFDDYANIVANDYLDIEKPSLDALWQASWSTKAGPLKRPISMFSFALNTMTTGKNPFAMKLTNLTIHLLAGVCLILISFLILSRWKEDGYFFGDERLVCILIGGIWLVHPFNLTGVLYIVQRMTSLSALFLCIAILLYCYLRWKDHSNKKKILCIIGVLLFSLLALFSKENAILIPLFLASIEIFVFKFKSQNNLEKKLLINFFILSAALPALVSLLYFFLNLETITSWYTHRSFSLAERLMTESRVLIWYAKMILVPDLGHMGLLLDEFKISTSLLNPVTTLASLICIISLLILSAATYKVYPFVGFGIMWFFSGHLLESTIIPLEIAFEHRNYLPSFGLLIIPSVFISNFFLARNKIKTTVALFCIWFSIIAYTTMLRAYHWQDPIQLALVDVENHPESARAHTVLADIYHSVYTNSADEVEKEELYLLGMKSFDNAIKVNPLSTSSYIGRLAFFAQHNHYAKENDVQKISALLSEKLIDSSTVSSIYFLTQCQINRSCLLDTNYYMDILYSCLSNRTISAYFKSLILVDLSNYYARILLDYDTAEHLTREAIKLNPSNVSTKFALLVWLVEQEKFSDAEHELNIIKESDPYNIYKANILKWHKYIEELKAIATS